MKSVLFILKDGEAAVGSSYRPRGGLWNSAKFVVDMLVSNGVKANLVRVIDNNDIDREVTKYRPDICILEALWCVPLKFIELKKLHPTVEWIVRIHSETSFLSQEGCAYSWMQEYESLGIKIAVNSERMVQDLQAAGLTEPEYLPNSYPISSNVIQKLKPKTNDLHISCFGAISCFKKSRYTGYKCN